jgi:hypothetical protein
VTISRAEAERDFVGLQPVGVDEESLMFLWISIQEIPRPARNDKIKDVSQRHADATNESKLP